MSLASSTKNSEEIETTQVAIILNHGAGYSPDSLVDKQGLTEIKTKLPKFQVEVILSGEPPQGARSSRRRKLPFSHLVANPV